MNRREIYTNHDLEVYRRRGPVMVRGTGSRIYDEDDREHIDCAAGIGAAGLERTAGPRSGVICWRH